MSTDIKYIMIVCLFLWDIIAYIIDSFTGNDERDLNLFAGILATIGTSAVILILF
ncbi:hypothetical protein DNAM5_6 [Bacillus phage Vinny]|uniref:Uncharacterized protein n=1 Tax=Bacillus phage Vinny TaxID=1805955 RepID=A0A143FHQ6_9CAUD|nr:hypothetical protein DNAM5_6 [Bacillus phage Vinny]